MLSLFVYWLAVRLLFPCVAVHARLGLERLVFWSSQITLI